jgi:hypothetical protein
MEASKRGKDPDTAGEKGSMGNSRCWVGSVVQILYPVSWLQEVRWRGRSMMKDTTQMDVFVAFRSRCFVAAFQSHVVTLASAQGRANSPEEWCTGTTSLCVCIVSILQHQSASIALCQTSKNALHSPLALGEDGIKTLRRQRVPTESICDKIWYIVSGYGRDRNVTAAPSLTTQP